MDHAKQNTKFECDLLKGLTYKLVMAAMIVGLIAWAVIGTAMSGDIMWLINFLRY